MGEVHSFQVLIQGMVSGAATGEAADVQLFSVLLYKTNSRM